MKILTEKENGLLRPWMVVSFMTGFHHLGNLVVGDNQFPLTEQFLVCFVVHRVVMEKGLVLFIGFPNFFILSTKIVSVRNLKFVGQHQNLLQTKVELTVHFDKSLSHQTLELFIDLLVKGMSREVVTELVFQTW